MSEKWWIDGNKENIHSIGKLNINVEYDIMDSQNSQCEGRTYGMIK